ncbi:MAG: beta-lactamase family protein [Bacteroidales bacterium]|nr:beta-lactamase family protein [Bacteroidales bacterium]
MGRIFRMTVAAVIALIATGCVSRSAKLDGLCRALFPADEPGAAVLVMQGDSILFDRGYGIADMSTGAQINGDTFFNIASVSKQFTAVAVLQLASQGLLSLEDPVSKYYPDFEAGFWKDIRIRHLMSHSSGIPDARNYPREVKIHGDETLSMAYLDTLSFLHFEPGTAYEYINPTFVLLGSIVEKVSGQPFTDYVREHIFTPAGMAQTLYFDRDRQELIPNMAHGYEYTDVEDMPEERTAGNPDAAPRNWYEYDFGEETFFATRPDGGIYTSTHEFVQWERALREAEVLPEEYLQDSWTPHTLVSDSPWSDYQNRPKTWYGYGWFIEPATDSTNKVIYHTGDNGGFKILAARYPESNALVLVFANRADWDRYGLMQQIEKIYGF